MSSTNISTNLSQWLALFHVPGLGPGRFSRLLRAYGSPEALLERPAAALAALGLDEALVRRILTCGSNDAVRRKVDRDLRWAGEPGQIILTLQDPAYPPLLREIAAAPPVLYVRGRAGATLLPQFAIVGSRKCSATGREFAHHLASELSACGLAICSGLAAGIDTEAHRGALAAPTGLTTAVTGTGINVVYPKQNGKLASKIVERGAIISEFPLNTQANPEHFPRRNRIISGMSLGLLVVEAALKSGSLISARLAMEQGREVFAVPGSIHNPVSKGCHRLIREGATLATEPEHVLEQLGPLLESHLSRISSLELLPTHREKASEEAGDAGVSQSRQHELKLAQGEGLPGKPAGNAENKNMCVSQRILDNIGHDVVHADTLVSRTGLPIRKLSPALVELELAGKIGSVAGGYVLL